MKIVLSVNSTIKLARCIASFRRLGNPPGDYCELDALLDSDRDEITATAIRSAFAEVMLEMARYVTDVQLSGDPDVVSAEFEVVDGNARLSFMAVAKVLEETVATRALALLLTGTDAGQQMLERSRLHARSLESYLQVREEDATSVVPFVRRGYL